MSNDRATSCCRRQVWTWTVESRRRLWLERLFLIYQSDKESHDYAASDVEIRRGTWKLLGLKCVRKTSDAQTEKFIDMFEARQCLWQTTSPEYSQIARCVSRNNILNIYEIEDLQLRRQVEWYKSATNQQCRSDFVDCYSVACISNNGASTLLLVHGLSLFIPPVGKNSLELMWFSWICNMISGNNFTLCRPQYVVETAFSGDS